MQFYHAILLISSIVIVKNNLIILMILLSFLSTKFLDTIYIKNYNNISNIIRV